MSVMNRKMFANRDARNKLAGMGGILASSPELMGATQRFQDGGVSTPRGVPDSPRLSESLESSAPIATIGGKSFFLSEDGGYIVDAEGSVVRDPSVLSAVMQQVLPQTQAEEAFVPPSMGPTELNTPGVMAALDNAPQIQAELAEMGPEFNEFGPEGLAARTAAAERDNQERMDLLAARDAEADRMMGINDPVGSSINEFGPEGLAARTAAAERDNQERVGILAARDAEADRMMGVNDPVGSSMEDRSRMRIDEEDRVMTTPVPQPLSDIVLPMQDPEVVSEPQANTFAGIEDIGLDAREAALQNAGRMSAQEKMDLELNTPGIMAALNNDPMTQPEVVSEPQANTFAGIEDIGLDAREAALQNAGRMSAQEKMDLELSEVPQPVVEAADPVVTPDPEVPTEGGAADAGQTEFAPIITKIDEDPANAGAIVSEAMLDGSGVDTSNMGVKERTVAMKKMLNDLMGQTDADEKEEFWMNMAMIGFGIASGDSPDAMKNIADGLLAGTAQITKGKADKKARDDKFTLTAFGEVLADERAREKFARDLALQEARGADSIYGKRKDPLTQTYQLAETLYAGGAGEYDTYEDALKAARTQVGQDYKLDLGGGGTATHAELNAAAKAAGQTQYVGPDGNNYKVQ